MSSDNLILYELAGADAEIRFSPHCWKTRLALAHKRLEPQRTPWRFSEKEAIGFSGQGRVPVLVHRPTSDGETIVPDSWRIALHLEEAFPDRPSLFGSTDAVPLARFVNAWADATLLPVLVRILLLDIFACLHPDDRAYFRASREARFGMPLEQVAADPDARLAEFRTVLTPFRQILADQPFLSGAAPAYADYCVFGMFMWAHCVSPVSLLEKGDPVEAWRERLMDAFDGLARQAPSAASES